MLSGRRVGTTGLGFVLRRGAVRGHDQLGRCRRSGRLGRSGDGTWRDRLRTNEPLANSKPNTHEGDRSEAHPPPVSVPVFVRPETHLANSAAEIVAVFSGNIKPAFRL